MDKAHGDDENDYGLLAFFSQSSLLRTEVVSTTDEEDQKNHQNTLFAAPGRAVRSFVFVFYIFADFDEI